MLAFWLGHVPLVRNHLELFIVGVVVLSAARLTDS